MFCLSLGVMFENISSFEQGYAHSLQPLCYASRDGFVAPQDAGEEVLGAEAVGDSDARNDSQRHLELWCSVRCNLFGWKHPALQVGRRRTWNRQWLPRSLLQNWVLHSFSINYLLGWWERWEYDVPQEELQRTLNGQKYRAIDRGGGILVRFRVFGALMRVRCSVLKMQNHSYKGEWLVNGLELSEALEMEMWSVL